MEYFIISHNLMLCMNWWRDADTIILRLLTAFLNDLELKLCCLHFILNKCNPNSIPSLYACKKSVWLWLKCKQISKNVKVFVKINYYRTTSINFKDYFDGEVAEFSNRWLLSLYYKAFMVTFLYCYWICANLIVGIFYKVAG